VKYFIGNLEKLNLVSENGQYTFYISPSTDSNPSTKVLVGNERQAIIKINQWDMSKYDYKYGLL
jgi:hypothetical protein